MKFLDLLPKAAYSMSGFRGVATDGKLSWLTSIPYVYGVLLATLSGHAEKENLTFTSKAALVVPAV